MTAAIQSKSSAPSANPHMIAALSLAIILGLAAMAVLILGDPRAAAPWAVAAVPEGAPAPGPLDRFPVFRPGAPSVPLRGDDTGLDDPMLDVLAPPPGEELEIALPGVAPIEEAAPVRTSAELAAAEREAAQAGADLPRAPIEGFTEPGPGGLLPVIGPEGRRPAEAYARPFTDTGKPAIAVIVGGLGWDPDGTRRAINDLPPEITLGFSPYAPDLQRWIDEARAAGHEVVVEIPMEPFDYPQNDPGEHTLLTSVGAQGNISRLEWLMSRGAGYFAVMNYMGGKFVASEPALEPVLNALAARGVDLIYDGAPARGAMDRAAARAGLRWASTDRALDAALTGEDVSAQLSRLEAMAVERDTAMGAGFAYPVVVDQVRVWAESVESRGYALAPASAVLNARAANAGR